MMSVASRVLATADCWQLSEGEIHYVWWFIQGSIMEADVRWRLRRAWGMCQRHAWGALAAEAAFRQNYFHGPAVLYHDLLGRALKAFELGPWSAARTARRLRPTGPCMMCEMGFDKRSRSPLNGERVDEGRDLTMIRDFARATRSWWANTVCGTCSGGEGVRARCRLHLLEDIRHGTAGDLVVHRDQVAGVLDRLTHYARSFRWECRGTDTDRDRAALVSAVGWCNGWEGGLALFGDLALQDRPGDHVVSDGTRQEAGLAT